MERKIECENEIRYLYEKSSIGSNLSFDEEQKGQILIQQKLINGKSPEIQCFSLFKDSISEDELRIALLEIQQNFPCWNEIQKIGLSSKTKLDQIFGNEFFLKCSIWGYRPMTVSGITAFLKTSLSDVLGSHSANEVQELTLSSHHNSKSAHSWKTDKLDDNSEIVLQMLKEGEGFLYLGFILILHDDEKGFSILHVCTRLLFEIDRTLMKNLGLFFNPVAKDVVNHKLARHLRSLIKAAFVHECSKLAGSHEVTKTIFALQDSSTANSE
jgi:hypothetical protein